MDTNLQMRKLKIYLDTSVINFLFADDAPEYKKITVDFFENYINEYKVYLSEVVLTEIANTLVAEKRKKLQSAITKYNLQVYDKLNAEIEQLALTYIEEKIVPSNKLFDALHIAYATYYEFDVLLSWNFKHLANIRKQIQVNAANEKFGYTKKLNLLNPMEVIYEK